MEAELLSRVKTATGAIEVISSKLNDHAWELQLIFTPPRSFGELISALVSLKDLLGHYGFLVKEPRIDSPGDYIVILVKVYRRPNGKPTYTM